MSQKPRRIDLHPDQFIAGIAGKMSPAELGVYWIICLRIYSHGGTIADTVEEIAGLFKKCNPRTIRAAMDQLEVMGKLHRIDGELMANGCRTEIEAALNRIRIARENGLNGGRPLNKNNDLDKPNGFQEGNPPAPSLPLPPSLSKDSIVIEPYPEKAKRKRAKNALTPIPDNFSISPEEWAYAEQLGLDPSEEEEKFINHHTAKGSVFADWSAAWKNWCRKAVEFRREIRK